MNLLFQAVGPLDRMTQEETWGAKVRLNGSHYLVVRPPEVVGWVNELLRQDEESRVVRKGAGLNER